MRRTAQSIANEVRMARSQFEGIYVIVEGTTDVKVYGGFTAEEGVRFIDARDKAVAVEAVRLLNAAHQTGVLAVVDADFDRIPPRQLPQVPNVLYCDCHDVEALLLSSPSLDKVLRELGSPEKIRTLEQDGTRLRTHLFQSGRLVGALRLLSITDGLNLRFDEKKFSDFVPDDTPTLSPERVVKAIKNHSQAHHLEDAKLLSSMHMLVALASPDHELACGHDMAAILAVWLRRLAGSCKATDVDFEVIESMLRVGYERAYFETTRLFQEMRAWEAQWGKTKLFAF